MRAIGSVLLFLFTILWSVYVLLPYDRCVRVERLSEPIAWGGKVADVLVSPWVSEKTRYRVAKSFIEVRVAASNYLRRQFFYGDGELEFGCRWDDIYVPEFHETAAGIAFLEQERSRGIESSLDEDKLGRRCWIFLRCYDKPEAALSEFEAEFTGVDE